MVNEEKEKGAYTDWFEGAYYRYVYIGEEYITVEMYQRGWSGGIRGWNLEEPVTFERKTGKAVPLETFFKGPQEEPVAEVTAPVYKYMEPEQFFLFPEGIGIYYERYAIDSGAAGDCLFIVPF